MRQIKFRALCEYETQFNTHIAMVHFGLPEMDNGLWAFPIDKSITHINSHETPLMQFTGLHDRNGVEIYEGDIVKLFSYKRDIQFLEGAFGYFTQLNENASFIHISNYHFEWVNNKSSKIEVIGNIYEHPNLLTNE